MEAPLASLLPILGSACCCFAFLLLGSIKRDFTSHFWTMKLPDGKTIVNPLINAVTQALLDEADLCPDMHKPKCECRYYQLLLLSSALEMSKKPKASLGKLAVLDWPTITANPVDDF